MTTDTTFAVFEDFNEPREAPAPPPAEDEPAPFDELGEIREQAWTDGYLTGRQERDAHGNDQAISARLLTSVHDLEAKAAEAVDAASVVVADLLVNAVIAVTTDTWSARLLDRVRSVADRIKPALTVAPEFVLSNDEGSTQCFGDISALSHALEAGDAGESVTIRWHRGEATISRSALLADLRDAIIPLAANPTVRNPL
ncbi:MAG TPA: hypothetical protein VH023_20020 [Rhodopila sp.]|jgi:hypothetical protein|nr:hypothetical protein [Rhodopila sp.]